MKNGIIDEDDKFKESDKLDAKDKEIDCVIVDLDIAQYEYIM